jgi:hypothetical protein
MISPLTPEGAVKFGLSTTKGQLDGYVIYRTEYPPPVFLFDGLLSNGLTLFAGRPKCGKSWLTLQMAVDAARGDPFLDRFTAEHAERVLYCGLEEGPRRTHHRLRKLVPTEDIQLQNIEFLYELPTLAQGGIDELERILSEGRFGLVVIDTFLRFAGVASGRMDVMRAEYAEMARLQTLAHRHELAIVLVDHTRKMGADNSLDTVSGTTGKTAACDAVWTLQKKSSGECVLEVTGREMEEQTLGLRMVTGDPFGWQLTGEGVEVGMSEQRQEIVELLRDEAPLSPARIADLLRKNAVTTRRHLQRLAADDAVRKDSSGKYYLTGREQRERLNGVNDGNR